MTGRGSSKKGMHVEGPQKRVVTRWSQHNTQNRKNILFGGFGKENRYRRRTGKTPNSIEAL